MPCALYANLLRNLRIPDAMTSVRIIGATLDMPLIKAVIEDAEILRHFIGYYVVVVGL